MNDRKLARLIDQLEAMASDAARLEVRASWLAPGEPIKVSTLRTAATSENIFQGSPDDTANDC